MDLFIQILFWGGIILMIDGSVGLYFHDRLKHVFGRLNITRVAFVEIGIAILFLLFHYLLRLNRVNL